MSPKLRGMTVGLWVLRALAAALFLSASIMKLTGQPMMVTEFDTIGLGQWFRYFTGAVELVGAAAVLVPRLSPFGAIILLAVDAGAFVAQVAVLHMDWIHTVVIALVLGAIVYLQRDVLAQLRRSSALS